MKDRPDHLPTFPERIDLPETKPGPDDWIPKGEAVKWIATKMPSHENGLAAAENVVRASLRNAIKAGKLTVRDGKVRVSDVSILARGFKGWRGAANVLPAIHQGSIATVTGAMVKMKDAAAREIARQAKRIEYLEADIARKDVEIARLKADSKSDG